MMRAKGNSRARSSLLCLTLAAVYSMIAPGQSAAPKAATPQTQYRITGVLVNSVDGSPVQHGHLEAALTGSGRQAGQQLGTSQNSAGTDDQGRFVLPLPSAGLWNVTAWARGFVRQGYQQHEEFTTGLVLTRAEPAMDIRFTLSPDAAISGVVTNDAGEAVRGAQVSLVRVRPSTPGIAEPAAVGAEATTTDDRGMYEFDDLKPGRYRVRVVAQPWYAVAARQRPVTENDPPLDPSLDVTYQTTWFPGTADADAAETLSLKAGDSQEADVSLTAVPAAHLVVDPPTSPSSDQRQNRQVWPTIQRIDSGGEPMGYTQPSIRRVADGPFEVEGLAPGLYQIRLNGPGQGKVTTVRVTADGTQTVNFDAVPSAASVSFHIDGLPDGLPNLLIVSLIDPESHRVVASMNLGGGPRPITRLRNPPGTRGNPPAVAQQQPTLNVPAGQYEVVLMGQPELYLGGVTGQGAQATGRSVTLPGGGSSLTLHVVKGRATLTGFASFKGKPAAGAVVMLVPATLGQTGALQIVRRDQSNSDGSFNIAQVIPGQYILIAINDGWNINWNDTKTLQRYLTGGVAVDLPGGGDVAENVDAQAP